MKGSVVPVDSKCYILVHGAWHGSWCWNKVAHRLQGHGHTVITPDLPGHFKNTCDFRDVTLASYIAYIENIIRACEKPVVLVGHSMAGVVITQVAENMPDAIEQLIYINAFIPPHENSLQDETKQESAPTISQQMMIDKENAWIEIRHSSARELFYGNCSDADIDYALTHFQPQPLHPFTGQISISDQNFGRIPKLYVHCLKDQAILPTDQQRMYTRAGCKVVTLDTDHSPFFSSDRELVELMSMSGLNPYHVHT